MLSYWQPCHSAMLLVPKYTASLPINFTSSPTPLTKGQGTHTTQEATHLQPMRNLHFERQNRKSEGEWERAKNWFPLHQIHFPTKFAIPGKPGSTRQADTASWTD